MAFAVVRFAVAEFEPRSTQLNEAHERLRQRLARHAGLSPGNKVGIVEIVSQAAYTTDGEFRVFASAAMALMAEFIEGATGTMPNITVGCQQKTEAP